jgi:hypothetical protein
MRKIENILKDLNGFKPNEDNELELYGIIEELWETGMPQLGLEQLFLLVEEYPEVDADYDFVRLVHAFEDIDDYENGLIKSLDRCPCYINLLLVKRIENSGKKSIRGRLIKDIYLDSLSYKLTHESIKYEIKDWLQQSG